MSAEYFDGRDGAELRPCLWVVHREARALLAVTPDGCLRLVPRLLLVGRARCAGAPAEPLAEANLPDVSILEVV